MHVITRKRLTDFAERYRDASTPLAAWFRVMKAKRYAQPSEVMADFPYVSMLGGTKACFNIGGNKYRLVVDLRFDLGRVYIRHVLTHEEYDRRSKEGTL